MSPLVCGLYSSAVGLAVVAGFLCAFLSNATDEGNRSRLFWNVFEGFFFVMVLMHLWRLSPKGPTPALMWLIVVSTILVYTGLSQHDTEVLRTALLLECLGCSLFLLFSHYISVMWEPRRTSPDHKAICEEHERVSELLDNMLPKEVLEEMITGRLSLAYSYEDMTFLFADIVGFTRYCAEHTAEQAVHLVTRLFAEFDERAVHLGIYKVCTIGDAYVVVNEPKTLLQDKYGDCERVFNMANYMLETIARVREEVDHQGLDMRIGLHVGRFVGGVIGTKKLRFDVWGEDVLTGNRVESHGLPGRICVSQAAKEVLEECVGLEDLHFDDHVEMALPTGRNVHTWVCRHADEGESELV